MDEQNSSSRMPGVTRLCWIDWNALRQWQRSGKEWDSFNEAKESLWRRLRDDCGRNMAFRVELAPRAFDDLDEIADYIRRNGSFKQAEDWFNAMIDAIRMLEHMPSRCPVPDESEDVGQQVRVLLHGKRNRRYKVYYAFQESGPSTGRVRVFHIRHWARKSLLAGELRELMDEAPDET
jgi:plasmid stabilization system protein ParE